MSRLAVLQLAPFTTVSELRAHFSALDLPITDVKVVYKKDGTSRGIGFVGFSSAEDAAQARDYFDNTYLAGRKIKVDTAREAKSVLQEPPRKRIKLAPVTPVAVKTMEKVSQPAAAAEELDDAAYLAARKKRKLADERNEPAPEAAGAAEVVEQDTRPTRIFLRNLAFSATEDDLRGLFEPYGSCTEIRLIVDQSSGQSKGLAYITFEKAEDAERAMAETDATPFHGRLLHILPAAERTGVATARSGRSSSGNATGDKTGSEHASRWASLYLNADAVAQAAAANMQASKADIVGPEVQNAAVRLALAETALVAETKHFLDQHGVATDIPTRQTARSDNIILVKNLPFATPTSTLEALFCQHGTIEKLSLSPSGVLAIVEYADRNEAASAMRNVAYRRVGKAPIYLEPAPLASATAAAHTSRNRASVDTETVPPEEENGKEEADATLYLKNLAWATTDDILATALRHLPGFAFARVQMKDDPKRAGQRLSMGFGFAGFKSRQDAESALPSVNGLLVDGHALQAAFARRNDGSIEAKSDMTSGEKASAKVVIKNLAFEVSKKELKELISAHGQIKSLRMPRKADRGTRGFAFVEFASKRDAQTAIAALSHTHLLGRHLVFEFATDQVSDLKLAEESRRLLEKTALPAKKSRSRNITAALSGATGHTEDDVAM